MNALEELIDEENRMEASGTMFVRVTGEGNTSWYAKHIGEVFKVYKSPTDYFGGKGYKCVDVCGGILVTDCEAINA